ncbi:hypothetical protein ACFSC6_14070 [Rufibacter sediminis]|uniref:Uncharacterized protein n=1 Tax=Rufibacter sediminis TaxID=2762756 RepID=A0ABR6W099_9BACT|nr:hypothetical protein [Rufibacter sediminis]MBC3542318.1 hypothetical protein [Rufibacter sediminis]
MEMNVSGLSFIGASQTQFRLVVNQQASKRPGGQTVKTSVSKIGIKSFSTMNSLMEFSSATLSEGIVLDGYFLGTFEFDSLTGHPGIRY